MENLKRNFRQQTSFMATFAKVGLMFLARLHLEWLIVLALPEDPSYDCIILFRNLIKIIIVLITIDLHMRVFSNL